MSIGFGFCVFFCVWEHTLNVFSTFVRRRRPLSVRPSRRPSRRPTRRPSRRPSRRRRPSSARRVVRPVVVRRRPLSSVVVRRRRPSKYLQDVVEASLGRVNGQYKLFIYSTRISFIWPHRGGSQRREPQKNFFNKFEKVIWSRDMCFSYGFPPYSACAKLSPFPTFPAYSHAP